MKRAKCEPFLLGWLFTHSPVLVTCHPTKNVLPKVKIFSSTKLDRNLDRKLSSKFSYISLYKYLSSLNQSSVLKRWGIIFGLNASTLWEGVGYYYVLSKVNGKFAAALQKTKQKLGISLAWKLETGEALLFMDFSEKKFFFLFAHCP